MKYSELCETYEELEKNPSRLKKTEILANFLKKLKSNADTIYLLQGKIYPDYSEKEIGISDKLIIKALAKASGISDSEILNKWRKLGDLGKVSEEIIGNKKQHTLFSHKLTVDKILENVRKLPELEGQETVDWKIVFEKAKRGIKALEDSSLEPGRPVKVMLFLKENSIEEGFMRVGRPALLDYKYDGFRMMINKEENGEIKIFTRRLDNVTKQFPEVKRYVEKYVQGKSFILDSEAVGYDVKTKKYRPFQEISQRIKRKYDIERLEKELPIEINVFDILFYNGKSLIKEPFKERRKILEKIIKKEPLKIRPSEALITDDLKMAKSFYKKALDNGEEGIMMKNLDAPYKPGARVGFGVKIKPVDNEFDLAIIGAEYGTGKRAGWLTSYDLACRHGEELLEIGKVSTGLKEKEEEGLSFIELTKKLKPLILSESGRNVKVKPEIVVTVVYQNIQKSPTYSSGFALRFPRITRLRPDRSKSDIASLDEIKRDYLKH